ncbi:DUF433 domain-containing protein [Candidatus Woesearchaeota archaeon]|nr:DUF433 domain-containing protein [Candidatus Woesearchaeota archaeon]
MKQALLNRIVINPKIMVGKPVIRGTRIPVELILKKLGQNIDVKEVLEDFPRLKIEDIKAAVMYAESLVENTEVFPLSPS